MSLEINFLTAGNKCALQSPFIPAGAKKLDCGMKQYYVMYTEKSLGLRRKLIRGTSTVNQVEMMYIATASELEFAEKAHKHYDGTNVGNVIGPVGLEHPDNLWRVSYKDKVGVYGPNHRHRVGGAGDAEPKAKADRRTDETMEPCFFRSMPLQFYDNMVSSFHMKGLIHLSIGDGHAAVAACENGIPIVGICMSDAHVKALHTRLVEQIYQRMQDPHSTLYHKALKAELDEASTGKKRKKDDDDDDNEKKTEAGKHKKKSGAGKGKAKSKRLDKKKKKKRLVARRQRAAAAAAVALRAAAPAAASTRRIEAGAMPTIFSMMIRA